MKNYQYDKKILKDYSITDFLKLASIRKNEIEKGDSNLKETSYYPNELAKVLHPTYQLGKVKEIKEESHAKTYVIEPHIEFGCSSFAYFKAGQYLALEFRINDTYKCRPFSICSSPKAALGKENNTYSITVFEKENGDITDYMLHNFEIGSMVVMSPPLGEFTYEKLRDEKHVLALVKGRGITSICSMAHSIADEIEDYELTILYESFDEFVLKEELDQIEKQSKGKVKVIYTTKITASMIQGYLTEHTSLFVSGDKKFYDELNDTISKFNLPKRRIRYEAQGEYGDPHNDLDYPKQEEIEYHITVKIKNDYYKITCLNSTSLLQAMENAGIHAPSDCRSGECGWCHSRLIKGEVYIPKEVDHRRAADKKFHWIHPCCSYPLSDIELEIYPID